MAIQSGLNDGVVDFGGSLNDTILLNNANRTTISALSIFNNGSRDVVVGLFKSPDETSGGGEKLESLAIPAGESAIPFSIIGQGVAADQYIIGRVQTLEVAAGDITCDLTYTRYTGNS